MPELSFTDVAAERALRRAENVADHWRFVCDGHLVLVSPAARAAALRAALSGRPQETGGLVVGHFLRDAEGPFTLVTDVVAAPAEAGSAGGFRMSPQLAAELEHDAARTHPTAEVVGWWHSHVFPSRFSRTDRETQQWWADPRQVGVLIFARETEPRRPWALVYLGPDGVPCNTQPPTVIADAEGSPGTSTPRRHTHIAPPGPRTRSEASAGVGRGITEGRRFGWTALTSVFALLSGGRMGHGRGGRGRNTAATPHLPADREPVAPVGSAWCDRARPEAVKMAFVRRPGVRPRSGRPHGVSERRDVSGWSGSFSLISAVDPMIPLT